MDETGTLQTSENFIKFGDAMSAKRALLEDAISSFFVLPANYLETGNVTVYSKGGFFSSRPSSSIEAFLISNLLRESNLEEPMKERIKEPANEEVITLNVEEESGVGFFIPYVLGILLILAIITSSGYLMQGIVAEKENKTAEILLSSMSANELLSGKILGFGSAGLLQVLVWICFGWPILFLSPFASLFQGIQISWILILAIVYFILGYLLFAGSMACAAAPASTVRDAQQGAMIFTMLGILPMILLNIIIKAPNSVIAKVVTYVPYTTSVTKLMRITLVEVPIYELVSSLVILVFSVLIMFKLSAKIFRTGMLMYGKKMKIKDVFGYLRG